MGHAHDLVAAAEATDFSPTGEGVQALAYEVVSGLGRLNHSSVRGPQVREDCYDERRFSSMRRTVMPSRLDKKQSRVTFD